jgi:hypothetical protein
MHTICASRSIVRSAERSAMSLPCRCAGAIIARPIAVAMKPHGGKMLALIQLSPPVRCGLRRIRYRALRTKWATKASLAAVGTDGKAKRDQAVTKRGPNDNRVEG